MTGNGICHTLNDTKGVEDAYTWFQAGHCNIAYKRCSEPSPVALTAESMSIRLSNVIYRSTFYMEWQNQNLGVPLVWFCMWCVGRPPNTHF